MKRELDTIARPPFCSRIAPPRPLEARPSSMVKLLIVSSPRSTSKMRNFLSPLIVCPFALDCYGAS